MTPTLNMSALAIEDDARSMTVFSLCLLIYLIIINNKKERVSVALERSVSDREETEKTLTLVPVSFERERFCDGLTSAMLPRKHFLRHLRIIKANVTLRLITLLLLEAHQP